MADKFTLGEEITSPSQGGFSLGEEVPSPATSKEPPAWYQGLGEGLLGGAQKTIGLGNMILGAAVKPVVPEAVSDWLFKQAQTGMEQGAEHTAKSGMLGQALGGLPSAATGALPAQMMTERYLELTDKGVDPKTAAKAAGIQFAVGAGQMAIPVGRGIKSGALLGGLGGVAGGVADPLFTKALIEQGYPDLAKQYQVNPEEVGKSALFQTIVGGILGKYSGPKKATTGKPELKLGEEVIAPKTVLDITPAQNELNNLIKAPPEQVKSARAILETELAKAKPRVKVVEKNKAIVDEHNARIEALFKETQPIEEPTARQEYTPVQQEVDVAGAIPEPAPNLEGVPNFLRERPTTEPTPRVETPAFLREDSPQAIQKQAERDAAYDQVTEMQKAETAKVAEEYNARQEALSAPLTLEPSQSSRRYTPKNQRGAVNTGFSEAVVQGFKRATDFIRKDKDGNPMPPELQDAAYRALRQEISPDDPKFIAYAVKTPDLPRGSKVSSTGVAPGMYAMQQSSGGNPLADVLFAVGHKNNNDSVGNFSRYFGEKIAATEELGRTLIKGKVNPDSFNGRLLTLTGDDLNLKHKMAGEFANLQSAAKRGEQVAFPDTLRPLQEAWNKSMDFLINAVNERHQKLGLPPINKIDNYITASGRKEFAYVVIDKKTNTVLPTNFQHVSQRQLNKNLPEIKTLLAKNGYNVDDLEFKIKRRSEDFLDSSVEIAKAFKAGNPAKAYFKESKNMLSDLDLSPEVAGKRLLENQQNYADAIRKYTSDLQTQIDTKALREALEAGGNHERTLAWFDDELRNSLRGTIPTNQLVKNTISNIQTLSEFTAKTFGSDYVIPQQLIRDIIRTPSMIFYGTKVLPAMNQVIQGFLALENSKGHSLSMAERYGVPSEAVTPALAKATTDFFTGSPRAKELGAFLYDRGILDQAVHRVDVVDAGAKEASTKLNRAYESLAQGFGKADQMGRYVGALMLDNLLAKHIPDVAARNRIIETEVTRLIPDMRTWNKPSSFKRVFGAAAPLATALDSYWAHYWGSIISHGKMAAGRGKVAPIIATALIPMMFTGPKSSFVTPMVDAYTKISNGLAEFNEWVTDEPQEKAMTPSEKWTKFCLMEAKNAENGFDETLWLAAAGGAIDATTGRNISKAVAAPSPFPSVGAPVSFMGKIAADVPGAARFAGQLGNTIGPDYRSAISLAKTMTPSMLSEPLDIMQQKATGATTFLDKKGKPTAKSADMTDLVSMLGYKGQERQLSDLESTERFNLSINRQNLIKKTNSRAKILFQSPLAKDFEEGIGMYTSLLQREDIPIDVKVRLEESATSTLEDAFKSKFLTQEQYIFAKDRLSDTIIELIVKGQME